MKRALAVLLLASVLPALAQQWVEGEVRKVDKAANRVTLKHGPIPNIDMPAMTMAFQAKDPAMLAGLKAGDKVKFEAQKQGDVYTVTRIERAR
jgi:Cu/Ag efflux protein CusF